MVGLGAGTQVRAPAECADNTKTTQGDANKEKATARSSKEQLPTAASQRKLQLHHERQITFDYGAHKHQISSPKGALSN